MPMVRSKLMETAGERMTVLSASVSMEMLTVLQQPVDRAAWIPSKSLESAAQYVKVRSVFPYYALFCHGYFLPSSS